MLPPRVSTLTATTRPTFTNTAAGEHTRKKFPAYFPVVIKDGPGYGAPISQASLETADGQTIDANATLGKGTYRMLCYINTVDGMAQGYVSISIKGISTYSACGSIRASSAARKFFVMMTAAFGGKNSARVVDMLSQREGIF